MLIETLEIPAPTQVDQQSDKDKIASATVALTGGFKGLTWGTLAMNIALAGSLQHMWSMINSLQLVLHLPAYNVNMPGNVHFYMS